MTSNRHQLRSMHLGDDARAWTGLGFSVKAEPGHGGPSVVELGSTSLVLTGSGAGFEGWDIDGVDGQLDGLSTTSASTAPESIATPGPDVGRPDPEVGQTPHPNGIHGIDHVVVTTGSVERTAGALEGAGLTARRERSTTSYGSPTRQLFYWLGDVILELVGPDEGEPTTDDPARVFGLALVARDLDRTVEQLGELAGTPREAVQERRRIASLRGRDLGVSLPLVVMSPHPR